MRLVFMGTPIFAVPVLASLLNIEDSSIVGVYTPHQTVLPVEAENLKLPQSKNLPKKIACRCTSQIISARKKTGPNWQG